MTHRPMRFINLNLRRPVHIGNGRSRSWSRPVCAVTIANPPDGAHILQIDIFPRRDAANFWSLDAELRFQPNGLLTGSLRALTFESDYAIDSRDGIWTFTRFGSDNAGTLACFVDPGCSGATGR